jgi:hypothetical protein
MDSQYSSLSKRISNLWNDFCEGWAKVLSSIALCFGLGRKFVETDFLFDAARLDAANNGYIDTTATERLNDIIAGETAKAAQDYLDQLQTVDAAYTGNRS